MNWIAAIQPGPLAGEILAGLARRGGRPLRPARHGGAGAQAAGLDDHLLRDLGLTRVDLLAPDAAALAGRQDVARK